MSTTPHHEHPRPLRRTLAAAVALALPMALGACGQATEVAVEKSIGHEAAKDGVQVKADLQGGQARVTTTDAQGQTTRIVVGGAGVTEAELGVPLYPGARVDADSASRVDTPDLRMVTVLLETGDPADKVAAFYRDLLKQRAAGQSFMDVGTGDGGATLVLGRKDDPGDGIQIQVSQTDGGSSVMISATRTKP